MTALLTTSIKYQYYSSRIAEGDNKDKPTKKATSFLWVIEGGNKDKPTKKATSF
jgi:hypothetical protein